MFKTILPFYVICFVLYIFFSRQPDYLDGEFTTGTIHYIKDSHQHTIAKVFFMVDTVTYSTNAFYFLRRLKENETVAVIYDTSNPAKAAVYKWWGYWLQWNEIIASVIIPFILYYAAMAITNNPTPEVLMNDIEMKKIKRRKYD